MLVQCQNDSLQDPRGIEYAGATACAKCHSDVYNSYIHTAHFKTSQAASKENIFGSFNEGSNIYSYNSHLKVGMKKHNDSLFQIAYLNNYEVRKEPFDVTIGNVKAQTYLYWKGDQLFQLPVSYFKGIHNWANSPAYIAEQINFNRPIYRRCLECHASYIKDKTEDDHNLSFEKESLIYGIDCERCHGPAARHVTFHTENPEVKNARFIAIYSSLSKAQRMDACAVCHSGNQTDSQGNTFFFKMGDTLSNFKPPIPKYIVMPDSLDVHVNQSALLSSSKCFIASNMDCGTCHNSHKNQRGDLALFTQYCIDCHNDGRQKACPLTQSMGTAIKTQCVNCHMPQRDSHIIKLNSAQGKSGTPYLVRSHHIAVYPDETRKIIAFINQRK